MRNRLGLSAAILLVSAGIALAQTPPAAPATPPAQPTEPAEPALPSLGSIDFGARITGTDGDAARFERYRDLRDGVSSLFRIGKETPTYFFDASASNVGYRDQRYKLKYDRHRLNFDFPVRRHPDQLQLPDGHPVDGGGQWRADHRPGAAPAGAESNRGRCAVRPRRAAGLVQQSDPGDAGAHEPVHLQHQSQRLRNRLAARHDVHRSRLRGLAEHRRELQRRVDGQVGAHAVGGLLRLQQRQRAPAAARQPDERHRRRRRLGQPQGDVPHRLGRIVLQQPDSVAHLGQPDPGDRLQQWPPAAEWSLRPERLQQWQRPGSGHMSLPPSNSQNVVSLVGLYKMARRTSVNGTLQFTSQSQNEALSRGRPTP